MLEYIANNATEAAYRFLNAKGYTCQNTPESVRRALELMNAKEGLTGFQSIVENLHPDGRLFEAKYKEAAATTAQALPFHKPMSQLTGLDLLLLLLAAVVAQQVLAKVLKHV